MAEFRKRDPKAGNFTQKNLPQHFKKRRQDVHRSPSSHNPKKLRIEPRPDWHALPLPLLPIPSDVAQISPNILRKVQNHAESLLENEASIFGTTRSQSSSQFKFMSTIMSSGTWNDKVSALTLVVQESPLHTFKSLESLVGLAGKRSRTQALVALEALKDLLGQGMLLPADRKLRSFSKQPALNAAFRDVSDSWTSEQALPAGLDDTHLIFWAYEDKLKNLYFEMLKILERWLGDEVDFSRFRAVTMVWELLKEKPEQEENLLRLLVNKLGDTSKKIASRASYLLLQLQIAHPSMKPVVINAIESDILLRSGQNPHAKYYAVITLNQTILQTTQPEVANKLLDVYFDVFVTMLNHSKRETSAKRKFHRETGMNPKKGKNAEVGKSEQELQEKTIAQVLTGINRAFPFSKKDGAVLEQHLDTMFRITHSSNFNTSVQALMLIQQISSANHIAVERFMRTLYESLLDPRLLQSSKQTMYLNLLYRSLKSESSVKRVKAFVKRLLQIAVLHDPPFACPVLYLAIELQKLFPGVKAMLDQPEPGDDDDEEIFVDVPEDEENETKAQAEQLPSDKSNSKEQPKTTYDGRKRDPEHSNADYADLWELIPWSIHYHPSVTVFANHLLTQRSKTGTPASTQPPPKPDPASHTLIHFLDRFAYRNPKTRIDSGLRGSSLMQPALASRGTTDSFITAGPVASVHMAQHQPVNTEDFWKRRAEDVAADEVFFHKYFALHGPKRKGAEGKQKAKNAEGEERSADGEFGEEDEEEIWKAIAGTKQDGSDVELGEGEESDVDEAEFDYEDSDIEIEAQDAASEVEGDEVEVGDSDVEDMDVDEDVSGNDDTPLNLEDEEGSALFSSEEEAETSDNQTSRMKDEDDNNASSAKKRRKLRNLPTFASVEDYAHLLDGDEDADGVQ